MIVLLQKKADLPHRWLVQMIQDEFFILSNNAVQGKTRKTDNYFSFSGRQRLGAIIQKRLWDFRMYILPVCLYVRFHISCTDTPHEIITECGEKLRFKLVRVWCKVKVAKGYIIFFSFRLQAGFQLHEGQEICWCYWYMSSCKLFYMKISLLIFSNDGVE